MLRRFLRYTGGLLRRNSEVTLLHVMSQIGASYRISDWGLGAEAAELIKKQSVEGQWLAEGLAILEKAAKVKAVPKVRHGLVVDEILEEAEQGGYDLIVLGNHRRGGWREVLVDDIARQVLARALCSVLVVHAGLDLAEAGKV